MDIRKFVQGTAEYGYSSVAGGLGIAGAGVGYVSELVGSLRIFGSTTTSAADVKFDERHYFLVPDNCSDDGYSLVVTRNLPKGVPPINDLPKRRVLHLPSPDAEPMLRSLLVRQAQAEELARPDQGKSMSDRARELADYIDVLDDRVFGGVLLIGGLVAIFNPLAGAAIAAKSLIPSLGMLASKYGLRVAEETLSQTELRRKAKQAEKNVLAQFRGASTLQQINPILTITEHALNTDEEEFDPMFELHSVFRSDVSDEERRMMKLASCAILDVYEKRLTSKRAAIKAGLGPEDIRLFELLATVFG